MVRSLFIDLVNLVPVRIHDKDSEMLYYIVIFVTVIVAMRLQCTHF